MKGLIAAFALAAVAAPMPVAAQSNDDDYTPLNSRIKRSRQFPQELLPRFIPPEKLGKVSRDWGRAMLSQYSRCLYNRSREDAHALLEKTDFGFVAFSQVGMEDERAFRVYGLRDCLRHIANSNSSGVMLRYNAASLRQLLIQAAYAEKFSDGPTWVQPGYVVAERRFPLSKGQFGVETQLEFADCVVLSDPFTADYFFRTSAGSADENEAIDKLSESLGPCLPEGQQVQLNATTLRTLLGEALWHAATHSGPADETSAEAAE